MEQVLVIGGTGMLAGVVEHLVKKGDQVTVLARSTEKFNEMIARIGVSRSRVTFHSADYFDTDALIGVLKEHIKINGTFDKAVLWMRSTAKESREALLDLLASQAENTDVFQVNGSASSRKVLQFDISESINMHHIILGFKIENGVSRWLTNEEISEGVIAALESRVPIYTAGVTEPWDIRPQY